MSISSWAVELQFPVAWDFMSCDYTLSLQTRPFPALASAFPKTCNRGPLRNVIGILLDLQFIQSRAPNTCLSIRNSWRKLFSAVLFTRNVTPFLILQGRQ